MFLTSPFFEAAKKQVLDTLFPMYCLGCQAKGTFVCDVCLGQLPIRLEQHCPACLRHITPYGQVCFSCRDTIAPALDGLFVASYYHDSILPHVIHTFKYRFIPEIALPLGRFLVSTLEKSALPLPDIIVPVPLHPRRLRFRGFNQSALLAEELAKQLTPGLDIPVLTNGIVRTRYTKPQMKTDSREERLANLKNAFALSPEQNPVLTGKSVWLIDDVATTGTTLEECARVLKQAGAINVFGIVLAR